MDQETTGGQVMQSFTAFGVPQPKGSTRAFIVKGRARTTNANKATKPWESVVAHAALEAGVKQLEGPVGITMLFCFQRPKSVSAKSRPCHTVKPDLDKLIRAVLDALTGIAYRDDSQVGSIIAGKDYTDCTPRVVVAIE
jgi:crossover junction endodeoxyribonuclease RusA